MHIARALLLVVTIVVVGACAPSLDPCPKGNDPITVTDAVVNKDKVTLTLSYAGGCEDHDVALWYTGAVGNSDPPQQPVELQHDAHGDSCEALITEERHFDFSVYDHPTWIQLISSDGDERLFNFFYDPDEGEAITDVEAEPIDTECSTFTETA